jgi:hypothetical protein
LRSRVWYAAARPPIGFVALSYRADIVQSGCMCLARSASRCWRNRWRMGREGRASEVAEGVIRLADAMVEEMVVCEAVVFSYLES